MMRMATNETRSIRTTATRFFSKLIIAAGAVSLSVSIASAGDKKLGKGDEFPKPTLPKLQGSGGLNFGALKGKVVIVDFWASWCTPCKAELPFLNELNAKYKDKGLVVVGVNLDEKREDALGFLKEHPVQMPLAFDGDKKVLADQCAIEKMPTSFILDRSGKIAVRHEAFKPEDKEHIEKTIVQLLKAK